MSSRNGKIKMGALYPGALTQCLSISAQKIRQVFTVCIIFSLHNRLLTKNFQAHRVGQVRAIFTIGTTAAQQLFGPRQPPMHLAYIEWFTPFRPHPEPHHGMFKTSRCLHGNARLASVVVVSRIRQSIHLFPCVGPTISRADNSHTIIDKYDSFFVNPYTDRQTFLFFSGLALI